MMTGFLIGAVVAFLVYLLVYSIALGATTYALSEVHLGRATSIRDAYRKLRGKSWRLFDVVVSIIIRVGFIFFLVTLGFAAVGIGIAFVARGPARPGPFLAFGVGVLVFLAIVASLAWVSWNAAIGLSKARRSRL